MVNESFDVVKGLRQGCVLLPVPQWQQPTSLSCVKELIESCVKELIYREKRFCSVYQLSGGKAQGSADWG